MTEDAVTGFSGISARVRVLPRAQFFVVGITNGKE